MEAQKRAADVSEIPAIWLVDAVRAQAATSGATNFWRVDGERDW
jgi:hypothetical protein